jgi:ribosomal protein L11 methyltransferase
MSWWRIRFAVPHDLAETAAWLIAEALDHPVEILDEVTMSRAAGAADIIIALDGDPCESTANAVRAALTPIGLDKAHFETQSSDDESWREGWRRFFKGQLLTARLWVGPPWEDKPDTAVAIHIEPGLAFGTGTHETTQGCLIMLDQIIGQRESTRIMDVGCGSGVLSIAAAQLGHQVLGVDIDPETLDNALHNVTLNNANDSVEIQTGDAGFTHQVFPVVVANILAPILVAEASKIAARCSGDLILSGLLQKHRESVLAAYDGWVLASSLEQGEWHVLHLVRR